MTGRNWSDGPISEGWNDMSERPAALQQFLDHLSAALAERSGDAPHFRQAASRLERAAADPDPRPGGGGSGRLPVCRHFSPALRAATESDGTLAGLSSALGAIEPDLTWRQRTGSKAEGEEFWNGHANAIVVGPGGLEPRDDVTVGLSLMAPDVTYPDHRHPPEEVYLVLSPGDWRQEDRPWHRPGIGGFVYNPSSILHAMRSGAEPLLAIWCLWEG